MNNPPKTPQTTQFIYEEGETITGHGRKIPVYTLEQLHEFAIDNILYHNEQCALVCDEIMIRNDKHENIMGYIVAEECAYKIRELTDKV